MLVSFVHGKDCLQSLHYEKSLMFKNVRWYQDKNLDTTNVPLVPAREVQILPHI
jgi:hypothetical protein